MPEYNPTDPTAMARYMGFGCGRWNLNPRYTVNQVPVIHRHAFWVSYRAGRDEMLAFEAAAAREIFEDDDDSASDGTDDLTDPDDDDEVEIVDPETDVIDLTGDD
jgi:hypothetical protein